MNYRSLADLSKVVRQNLPKIPDDVDLVVGIPRSGMLPASVIALSLNLRFCDIDAYLKNSPIRHGQTRKTRHPNIKNPQDARHLLVIDDSVDSASSMLAVRTLLSQNGLQAKITYAAVYATSNSSKKVDLYFEIVEQPRLFEWNLMHRNFLRECCVDIDGVLCVDPTPEQNDDGPEYRKFLLNAVPLALPSYPIGHLVTSRLEKYRKETEWWLKKHNVEYRALHMLDLPDAATRRNLGCHASFKANTFRKLQDTKLFIESEPEQAKLISTISGKHALCFSTQKIYDPALSYASVERKAKGFARRAAGRLYREVKKLVRNV